ncbi:MAG: hypothetical protein KJZ58_12010 [Flavobacteriales bacterium]|nr:hypothetical protein [Flavobacteriales bacterium]MCL4282975.1 hypothetical protein [Flavobacteriales bacterium]
MTLTLLLQLTDEEQLFAANAEPAVQPQEQQQDMAQQAVKEQEETCAQWPVVEEEKNS